MPFWPGLILEPASQNKHKHARKNTHMHTSVKLRMHTHNHTRNQQNPEHARTHTQAYIFLESTFTDQNNPKRQTADPLWGSTKLDLLAHTYCGPARLRDGSAPTHFNALGTSTTTPTKAPSAAPTRRCDGRFAAIIALKTGQESELGDRIGS